MKNYKLEEKGMSVKKANSKIDKLKKLTRRKSYIIIWTFLFYGTLGIMEDHNRLAVMLFIRNFVLYVRTNWFNWAKTTKKYKNLELIQQSNYIYKHKNKKSINKL